MFLQSWPETAGCSFICSLVIIPRTPLQTLTLLCIVNAHNVPASKIQPDHTARKPAAHVTMFSSCYCYENPCVQITLSVYSAEKRYAIKHVGKGGVRATRWHLSHTMLALIFARVARSWHSILSFCYLLFFLLYSPSLSITTITAISYFITFNIYE
jgi:hypothetical protein